MSIPGWLRFTDLDDKLKRIGHSLSVRQVNDKLKRIGHLVVQFWELEFTWHINDKLKRIGHSLSVWQVNRQAEAYRTFGEVCCRCNKG